MKEHRQYQYQTFFIPPNIALQVGNIADFSLDHIPFIQAMPWIWGKNRYLSEWHTGVGKTDPARHDVQVLSQGAFQQLMEQGQASNKGFTGAEISSLFLNATWLKNIAI